MNTEQKPIHSGFGETTTADEVIAGRPSHSWRRSFGRVLQGLAFQKFHRNEGPAIFLAYVMNGADIGMVQSRRCL